MSKGSVLERREAVCWNNLLAAGDFSCAGHLAVQSMYGRRAGCFSLMLGGVFVMQERMSE